MNIREKDGRLIPFWVEMTSFIRIEGFVLVGSPSYGAGPRPSSKVPREPNWLPLPTLLRLWGTEVSTQGKEVTQKAVFGGDGGVRANTLRRGFTHQIERDKRCSATPLVSRRLANSYLVGTLVCSISNGKRLMIALTITHTDVTLGLILAMQSSHRQR